MKATSVVLAATIALWPATVAAQARPDFAGRWTSEPEQTVAPQASGAQQGAARGGGGGERGGGARGGARGGRSGDMGSGWGSLITVTQIANRLTVEYAFFTRGDMQPPLRFNYALDGSETRNSVMMGRGIQEQTSRATWEGEKLVIVTTHTFENPETGQPLTAEVKRTLSLESPDSLVVEVTRSGVLGGPASTTRTVYRRVS